jgi:hypothetical protein
VRLSPRNTMRGSPAAGGTATAGGVDAEAVEAVSTAGALWAGGASVGSLEQPPSRSANATGTKYV